MPLRQHNKTIPLADIKNYTKVIYILVRYYFVLSKDWECVSTSLRNSRLAATIDVFKHGDTRGTEALSN
jgi:hypothetical protein